MRLPWNKSKSEQLDLVEGSFAEPSDGDVATPANETVGPRSCEPSPELSVDALAAEGAPLVVPLDSVEEDPGNPRTEFPEEEIAELARDIALRGILQPIVALPLSETSRYRVLFGAKRLRAARQAGLQTVPVVIGSPAHDAYAQVAENQKRHGLTPLDLARFIRTRADAGDSHAEIARRLGIDLTSVAHHLALLTLPPELEEAFRSGRCVSPRTLYELAKLRKTKPEQVKAIVAREGEITRSVVASMKKASRLPRGVRRKAAAPHRQIPLLDQANSLCTRLKSLLGRMAEPGAAIASDELATVRRRLAELAGMSKGEMPKS